jgi:hypothetical protein
MLRLLYLSQAVTALDDDSIENILRTAQRNNPKVGITGVLIHGGGYFMQLLEGPEQAVLHLYVKILDDRRHGNCQIIQVSPMTSDRLFAQWAMGSIKSDPLEFHEIAELRKHRREVLSPQSYVEAMRVFLKHLDASSSEGIQSLLRRSP